MKKMFAFVLLAMVFGCTKETDEQDRTLTHLIFTETNTSPTASMEGSIQSRVKCYGPDLCYQFTGFEIKETGARQYEIRAKATYPAGKDVACPQALYVIDTTISINPATTGQHILRFYNGNTLFKADTVQVN